MKSGNKKSRAENLHTLKWISTAAGKTKYFVLFKTIQESAMALLGVVDAFLMRALVNAATGKDWSGFRVSLIWLISLTLFTIIFNLVMRYLGKYMDLTVNNRFRKRVFSALFTKDYSQISRVHSGEWMHRINSDVKNVTDTMTGLMPQVVSTFVRLISVAVSIIVLEPKVLLLVLPGAVIIVGSSVLLRNRYKRMHREAQEAAGRTRVFMTERLASQLIIRTFGKEERTAEDADGLMDESKRVQLRNTRFSCFASGGMQIIMQGMYYMGLAFCGIRILQGTMTYGDLTAILQLVSQVRAPLSNISGFVPSFYGMLASAERLMEIEAFADDAPNRRGEEEISRYYESSFRAIELKDVDFTYMPPTREDADGQTKVPAMPVVLKGLNLTVNKGEYIAFRGQSGCGKSTVLKVMMCLYPVDSGERLIRGEDGERPLDPSWRGLYAYVPQGNQLLYGTIRQVLTFGEPEDAGREEELWKALRVACAEDFVSALDKGLDTPLGEHGAGLSEGQMQRLAIARAVFSSHPVLMLDECTSSLDEQTEEQLLHNLRSMTDKTVILVTHRPAALRIADRVIDFGPGEEARKTGE